MHSKEIQTSTTHSLTSVSCNKNNICENTNIDDCSIFALASTFALAFEFRLIHNGYGLDAESFEIGNYYPEDLL